MMKSAKMWPWRGSTARRSLPAILVVAAVCAAAPDPNRGLYAIWAKDPALGELPFIRGGQVHTLWKTVAPAPGRYDFSDIDRQLAALHRAGRVATVQLNGNQHPDFLFQRVPHTAKRLSVQVGDRQGTLQYWHPDYIRAYLDLIAAYGRHLKESPYRSAVLGVRLNFNALGTEHTAIPPEDRGPGAWIVPAGVSPGPVWTPDTAVAYRRTVVEAFLRSFTPEIRVFVRNGMFSGAGAQAEPAWVKMLEAGGLGLFHTSSEMEPRPGVQGQYETFVKYCRSGQTVCYAESWADSWGRHGGQTDARWCSPAQWNYWRLLIDLHCGVSFIAIYGADLVSYGNPEFRDAFEFAAGYAGYHASPAESPGAWVALREGEALQGDYSFLMTRLDPMAPLRKVGPDEQRFGAWARELRQGAKARFRLHPEFARSVEGRQATVQVTYLDRGQGVLEAEWGGSKFSTPLMGSNRWKTASKMVKIAPAGEITISGDTNLVLHMVEVQRR
jgi:hypothetical protein